eukprot:3274220-Pyramimonas_sp.AAC.1
MLFAGALPASICPLSTCISQVGHLIYTYATNASLAGPVFGERLGVLRGAPGGFWQSAAPRDSVEAAEANRGEWRLFLWQTTNGAYTSSSGPYPQVNVIQQALSLNNANLSLHSEAAPEEDGPAEIPVGDPSAEPDSDDEVPAQPDWTPADQLADLELAHDNSCRPGDRHRSTSAAGQF